MDTNNTPVTDAWLASHNRHRTYEEEIPSNDPAVKQMRALEAKLAALRSALEEISRDAWSGDKARMNAIGRAADKALADSEPGK